MAFLTFQVFMVVVVFAFITTKAFFSPFLPLRHEQSPLTDFGVPKKLQARSPVVSLCLDLFDSELALPPVRPYLLTD